MLFNGVPATTLITGIDFDSRFFPYKIMGFTHCFKRSFF